MKALKSSLFLLSLFLLISSSYTFIPLLKEFTYQIAIANKYNIKEINEHYAGASKTYEYADNTITASHFLTGEKPYLNGHDEVVYPANILISLNDEVIEVLERYPVQLTSGSDEYEVAVDGLDQYNYYLSYWLVEDQRADEDFFAVTIQLNGYDPKQINDEGIMEGYVDQNEFEYKMISIQKDGTFTKDFFTFQDKDKLQTQLITPMYAGKVGYYTDVLRVWPSAFFPIIYPFLTSVIGIILFFAFFPKKGFFRKRK